VADFQEIMSRLQERSKWWIGQGTEDEENIIPVPSGPVERW